MSLLRKRCSTNGQHDFPRQSHPHWNQSDDCLPRRPDKEIHCSVTDINCDKEVKTWNMASRIIQLNHLPLALDSGKNGIK